MYNILRFSSLLRLTSYLKITGNLSLGRWVAIPQQLVQQSPHYNVKLNAVFCFYRETINKDPNVSLDIYILKDICICFINPNFIWPCQGGFSCISFLVCIWRPCPNGQNNGGWINSDNQIIWLLDIFTNCLFWQI